MDKNRQNPNTGFFAQKRATLFKADNVQHMGLFTQTGEEQFLAHVTSLLVFNTWNVFSLVSGFQLLVVVLVDQSVGQ